MGMVVVEFFDPQRSASFWLASPSRENRIGLTEADRRQSAYTL